MYVLSSSDDQSRCIWSLHGYIANMMQVAIMKKRRRIALEAN